MHLDADDSEVTRRLLARAALDWYHDRGIPVSVDAMRPAQQVGATGPDNAGG